MCILCVEKYGLSRFAAPLAFEVRYLLVSDGDHPTHKIHFLSQMVTIRYESPESMNRMKMHGTQY